MLSEKNYTILKYSIIIRSITSYDNWIIYNIDDFSTDESEKVLDIINNFYRVFYTRSINLIFELKIQSNTYNILKR